MDGERFDALTRSLGKGLNRRQALKALFGGAVGLATTSVVRNAVAAAAAGDVCTVAESTCDEGLVCCSTDGVSGTCQTEAECIGATTTPAPEESTTAAPEVTTTSVPEASTTPAPEVTTTPPPDDEVSAAEETVNTPIGTNVVVDFPTYGVTVTFGVVVSAGDTSVDGPVAMSQYGSQPTAQQNPNGDDADILFIRTYAGLANSAITVCFDTNAVTPRLLWNAGFFEGPWEDRTTSSGSGVVCGDGALLGAFAVVDVASGGTTTSAPTTTTAAPTTTTAAPTTTTAAPTTTTAAPTTTTAGPNTGTGSNVQVTFPGVPGASLTFQSVSAGGVTAVTPIAAGSLPSLPSSSIYQNASGDWYEINTTATFSGVIDVCLPSDSPLDRLLHFESGSWIDVTFVGYPTGGLVCGEVTSLSPFGVVPLIEFPGDDDDDDDDDGYPPADDDDDDDDGYPPADDDDDDDGGKPYPPKPDTTTGTGTVGTLPSTGTGPEASNLSKLGLTLAASAAAAAAARLLRTPDAEESES